MVLSSLWTPGLILTLGPDIVGPKAPGNRSSLVLAGALSRYNLRLGWDGPTENQDGTPLYDLQDIRVFQTPDVGPDELLATIDAPEAYEPNQIFDRLLPGSADRSANTEDGRTHNYYLLARDDSENVTTALSGSIVVHVPPSVPWGYRRRQLNLGDPTAVIEWNAFPIDEPLHTGWALYRAEWTSRTPPVWPTNYDLLTGSYLTKPTITYTDMTALLLKRYSYRLYAVDEDH